mmetsp:Transcript_27052/g.81119  ORF Transcript_27052/g.81119 Transcript_27052/m.81119 type:complete len:162 (-) Transcript_27052:31-516(-)
MQILAAFTFISCLFGSANAFRRSQGVRGTAFGTRVTVSRQQRKSYVAMPSCVVQSAVAPKSGAEEFCKKLSSAVAGALSKPESYVLTSFTKVDAMCFGGSTEPAAFCYLSSIGAITPAMNKGTSGAISALLEEELGVPNDRYYINFFDSERPNCGWKGGTF